MWRYFASIEYKSLYLERGKNLVLREKRFWTSAVICFICKLSDRAAEFSYPPNFFYPPNPFSTIRALLSKSKKLSWNVRIGQYLEQYAYIATTHNIKLTSKRPNINRDKTKCCVYRGKLNNPEKTAVATYVAANELESWKTTGWKMNFNLDGKILFKFFVTVFHRARDKDCTNGFCMLI